MTRLLSSICLFILFSCKTADKKEAVPIKNGEVSISYRLSGKGDTSIVLVHGWCIDKEYWKHQQDALSSKYKVVSLDLGGHGQSGRNRDNWTIEEYAKDVIAVIDELELENVILVGHSMGGEIILQTALTAPDKIIGFIAVDNFKIFVSKFSSKDEKDIHEFMQALRTNFDTTAAMYTRAGLFPPGSPDTASINRVIKSIHQSDSVVAIKSLESLMQFALKDSVLISRLHIPIHLIVSDYTASNEQSILKTGKPGSGVVTIMGTGHYPMIEKPEEFTELLQETIYEIGKGRQ